MFIPKLVGVKQESGGNYGSYVMAMSIHSLPVVQSGQAFWSEDSSSPDRG